MRNIIPRSRVYLTAHVSKEVQMSFPCATSSRVRAFTSRLMCRRRCKWREMPRDDNTRPRGRSYARGLPSPQSWRRGCAGNARFRRERLPDHPHPRHPRWMSGLGPEDAADISLAVINVVVVVGPVARAVDGGAAGKKARHARRIPVLTYSRPPARYRGRGRACRPAGIRGASSQKMRTQRLRYATGRRSGRPVRLATKRPAYGDVTRI